MGATVPRVSASTVFCLIASKRLHKRLRTDWALSYSPLVSYDPLNAETVHLVLYADSDKDHRIALASVFGEVFEELNTIDDAEVETAKEQLHERWIGALAPPLAEQLVFDVQRVAMDWLFGKEYEAKASLVAEMLAVTASDVAISFVKYGPVRCLPCPPTRSGRLGLEPKPQSRPGLPYREKR